MIVSNILSNKYFVSKENKDFLRDLTRSSISPARLASVLSRNSVLVDSFSVMRPDLIAHQTYNDQNKFDLLLKYNGISNPFSLEEGRVLFIPSGDDLDSILKEPKEIKDIGNTEVDDIEAIFVDAKTSQDQKRLEMLKKQSKGKEILPSNVNKKGDKNIKVKDGRLVFGEDVTAINKNNCPEPISRANLKKALIKNNLFG
jgi:hypothetical protein